MNNKEFNSKTILKGIGERARKYRLNQNISQMKLAERAGVSRIVIQQLENGKGCGLPSLVNILRGLESLHQLDTLFPDTGLSPIQLASLQGGVRQRASGKRAGRP